MCHKVLQDAKLYLLLLRYDEDLAREAQQRRCQRCGGRLDQGHFPRKPRAPSWVVLPDGYDERFSYSCAVRSCRKRHTPASTRFLGRRIYLGIIVVLAAAMQQGPAPWRARRLREELGVSWQTLKRWREWWRVEFVESAFWKAARAAFAPPVAGGEVPGEVLERFGGDEVARLAALMRWLMPVTTSATYIPDRPR